jgi:hypothetical protein
MRDMTKKQRLAVAEWADKNCGTVDVARAYWALMRAMEGISEAAEATDVVLPELEELEQAWYDAREALGRRCLAAMKKA